MSLIQLFETSVDKEATLLIELAKEIDNLRQQWETPDSFFNLMGLEVGGFDIDVAASFENSKCDDWISEDDHLVCGRSTIIGETVGDGTVLDWFYPRYGVMKAWCNPPYAKPLPWVRQALAQVNKYPGSVAYMLLNHSPSPLWYELAEKSGQEIVILAGDRVQFDHPCRDMNLEQFIEKYGVYLRLARSLGEDVYIRIVDYLHEEYAKVYKSANSSNAKSQCVIKFRARVKGTPCFVWHLFWKQMMEEIIKTEGEPNGQSLLQ